MSPKKILLHKLYLIILLAFVYNSIITISVLAQQSQTEEKKDVDRFSWITNPESGNGQSGIYIDQVGLELLDENIFRSDYIDPSTYKLDTNDILSFDVKGSLSFGVRAAVINSSGFLSVPYAGNVNIAGYTLEEAHNVIVQALEKEMMDVDLDLNLQKPRSISVIVNGDIEDQGETVLPPATRLSDVVSLKTEGLNVNSFALRTISLMRSDSTTVLNADLITFYNTGDLTTNPYLYDGDKVTIVKLNENYPKVSLSGAVRRPVQLEYRPDDTLNTLLKHSLGYLPNADTTQIIRYKFDENNSLVSNNIDLSSTDISSYQVQQNEFYVVPEVENQNAIISVDILGQVRKPGTYPMIEGKNNIQNIISIAGGMTNDALPKGAYLMRSFGVQDRVPSAFSVDSARILRTADSFIQGLSYHNSEYRLMEEYRMYVDLSDNSSLKQIILKDGDKIMIPKDENSVLVYGQVNLPGIVEFNRTKKVNDYISQAGGYSLAADQNRIFVIKANGRAWLRPSETTIESGDMLFVDRLPYDDFILNRDFELQTQTQRRANIQLVLSTVTTVASILTTYFAIRSR